MATASERLAWLVTLDASGAVKGFEQVGRSAETNLSKAESKLDKLGGKMQKYGAISMAAAGVAATALYQTAQAAGSLEAAIAANEQVLGDASKAVQDWAKDSVDAVGLSERAAIEASTSFGQLAKVAGKTGDDVSSFSIEMVQLAADMAAFKDVPVDQALADLQSGFAGSTEVLRKYAIFLDDAGLKSAYFAATGEKVTGTLTAQQRVIATHAEIMRQSTDMQGQWNRESDSLIAQQAKLKAALENLQASIGAAVLPAFEQLVGMAQGAVTMFTELNDASGGLVGKAAGLGTAVLAVGGAMSFTAGKVLSLIGHMRALQATMAGTTVAAGTTGASVGALGTALGALAVPLAVAAAGYTAWRVDQRRITEEVDGLATALRSQKDGISGAVEDFVELSLAGEDTSAAIEALGFTSKELADFVAGKSAPAVEAFVAEMEALRDPSIAADEQLRRLEKTYGDNATEVLKLDGRIRELRRNYAEAASDFGPWSDRIALVGKGFDALAGEVQLAATASEDYGRAQRVGVKWLDRWLDSVSDAAEKTRDYYDALYDVTRGLLDYEDSQWSTFEAVAEYNETLGDSEATVTDVRRAHETARDEILRQAEAYVEANGATMDSKEGTQLYIDKLKELVQGIAPGSDLWWAIAGIIAQMESGAEDAPVAGEATGSGYQGAFTQAVEAGKAPVWAAVKSTVAGAKSQEILDSASGAGEDVGGSLADGVSDGIYAKIPQITLAAKLMVREAILAAKAEAQASSPSKATRVQIGQPLAEGVALGIEDRTSMVEAAMTSLVKMSLDAALDQLEERRDEIADRYDELWSAIDEASRQDRLQEGVSDAERALADARKELTESQRALGSTRPYTEEYAEALDDVAKAQERVADAEARLRDSYMAMLKANEDLIGSGLEGELTFRRIAAAAGLTMEQIDALVATYQELQAAQLAAGQAAAALEARDAAAAQVAEAEKLLKGRLDMESAIARIRDLGAAEGTTDLELASAVASAAKLAAQVQGGSELDWLRFLASGYQRIWDDLAGLESALASLPAFADGGVIPGPAGMPRLVIAHGGETVVPAGSGGTVVNLTVNAGLGADGNQVGRQIVDVLNRYYRSGGVRVA